MARHNLAPLPSTSTSCIDPSYHLGSGAGPTGTGKRLMMQYRKTAGIDAGESRGTRSTWVGADDITNLIYSKQGSKCLRIWPQEHYRWLSSFQRADSPWTYKTPSWVNPEFVVSLYFSLDMSLRKTLQLNNGISIPQVGLGTWLSKPHEVEQAVSWCIYVYEIG